MSTATLTIEPRPLAARLRIRKGGQLRVTGWDGVASDYRVVSVSMPDEFGRCTVSAEPTA